MTPAVDGSTEILEAALRHRDRREAGADAAALGRVRASVMSAFGTEMATRAPTGAPVEPAAGRPRSLLPGRSAPRSHLHRPVVPRRARPLVAAGLAAALTIVAVGGPAWVLASQSTPGRPFYEVRVAVEAVGLPGLGTAARVVAEAERLERRVAEVRDEVSTGDWPGAEAALRATEAEATALGNALAADPTARPAVRDLVRAAHRGLRATAADTDAPATVRDAARHAAETVEHVTRARPHDARRRDEQGAGRRP